MTALPAFPEHPQGQRKEGQAKKKCWEAGGPPKGMTFHAFIKSSVFHQQRDKWAAVLSPSCSVTMEAPSSPAFSSHNQKRK